MKNLRFRNINYLIDKIVKAENTTSYKFKLKDTAGIYLLSNEKFVSI